MRMRANGMWTARLMAEMKGGERQTNKEGKKERRKEGKKERRKEGKKERKKERRKERKEESDRCQLPREWWSFTRSSLPLEAVPLGASSKECAPEDVVGGPMMSMPWLPA